VLGHLGMALERDHMGGGRDDVAGGAESDLAGDAPDRGPQSVGVPQGGDAEQERQASSRRPPGAPPGVAQMGYPDSPGLSIMTQDILFEKSPKRLSGNKTFITEDLRSYAWQG